LTQDNTFFGLILLWPICLANIVFFFLLCCYCCWCRCAAEAGVAMVMMTRRRGVITSWRGTRVNTAVWPASACQLQQCGLQILSSTTGLPSTVKLLGSAGPHY